MRTDSRGSRWCSSLALAGMVLFGAGGSGCVREEPPDGKMHLTYWEKWERFERDAMEQVVDAFNASQDEIVVHYTSVGLVDRKTLTATAGGDPPDIAGMWEGNVSPFAARGALTPLSPMMGDDEIKRSHWIKVYADICTYEGTMWAVPTAPITTGLYWNKAMFREAGLDPDRPPRTLEELDAFAEILTKTDANGNYTQMGYLPQEPGWFHFAWGPWFGGQWMDDEGNITANHPRNIEAFEWIQSYARKYGVDKISRFASSFGNFASPQNPFFSGKIAMVHHGVWMHNYIQQYAPGMQYGAAPWPKTPNGPEHFSTAGCDILVIPRGVPEERRKAAWRFIKFVISQESMETLNLGQRKHTPLATVSKSFIENHPHDYIELFIEMAKYDDVFRPLPVGIWPQYQTEIAAVFEQMKLLQTNPATGKPYTAEESLDLLQERISLAWERHQQSLALREPVSERVD